MPSAFSNDVVMADVSRDVENLPNLDVEPYDDNDDILDDNASVFSTETVPDLQDADVNNNFGARPSDEEAAEAVSLWGNIEDEIPPLLPRASKTATPPSDVENEVVIGEDGNPTVPKERSIAHYQITNGKTVYMSFDIETGGGYAGIVQMSAELFRLKNVPGRKPGKDKAITPRKDTATDIKRDSNTFNEYVNPGEDAIWSTQATKIHGLHTKHPQIRTAYPMAVVWPQFEEWIKVNTAPDEVVILIAYNGETCDLKWLWKITQAPFSKYKLPSKIAYFIDPYRVMERFEGCPLNKSKTNLDSYELGVIWSYLNNNNNLNGAHGSLVDTRAQTDIVIHPHFVPYTNRSTSIQKITDIFGANQKRDWLKKMEPHREVHSPWMEQTEDSSVEWRPSLADRYTTLVHLVDPRPDHQITLSRLLNRPSLWLASSLRLSHLPSLLLLPK